MQRETRQALMEFYWPYNLELAELLNDPSVLEWNRKVS
jgi:hypothetical protein